MKTEKQVNNARDILCRRIEASKGKIDRAQLALLSGMLNALVWVADGASASTMDRILIGEPFAGKDGKDLKR